MNAGSVQRTAQIIEFPVGGRKAPPQGKPTDVLERQAAAVAASDAWYHDAAIEESKRIGEC